MNTVFTPLKNQKRPYLMSDNTVSERIRRSLTHPKRAVEIQPCNKFGILIAVF
jgi:hypothetical protein